MDHIKASDKIECTRKERIKREDLAARRRASSFRARRLPLSTVEAAPSPPTTRARPAALFASPPLIGLNLLGDGNGSVSGGDSSFDILNENRQNQPEQSGPQRLRSTLRAKGRAAFERRKSLAREDRRVQKENDRKNLAERLKGEREELRNFIR